MPSLAAGNHCAVALPVLVDHDAQQGAALVDLVLVEPGGPLVVPGPCPIAKFGEVLGAVDTRPHHLEVALLPSRSGGAEATIWSSMWSTRSSDTRSVFSVPISIHAIA